MTVDRLLLTDEARDLIQLTRDVADKVLAPIVDVHERAETYPSGIFATLGDAGLLSLPYPVEWGGIRLRIDPVRDPAFLFRCLA